MQMSEVLMKNFIEEQTLAKLLFTGNSVMPYDKAKLFTKQFKKE